VGVECFGAEPSCRAVRQESHSGSAPEKGPDNSR
jgi:hypothetical protein